MGTAEPLGPTLPGLSSLRFYSLSRDGDSGTTASSGRPARTAWFLFAVARWGQRNTTPWHTGLGLVFLFAVARWGQRNSSDQKPRKETPWTVSIRCREMGQRNSTMRATLPSRMPRFLFAVARWGQRNPSRLLVGPHRHRFLFAVARWGQRNTGRRDGRGLNMSFYSLSRDGDSGTRP